MAVIMLAGWLLLGAQTQDATPVDEEVPEEIIVTGRRNRCDIEVANQALSDAQFNARAREWAAGKPVQVRARYDADIKCLAKIAFRLADKGVTRINFVDPQGRPADPFEPSADTPVRSSTGSDTSPPVGTGSVTEAEHRFFRRRAALLVLDHKCAEAKKLLLEAGDLEGAADAVALCKAE